MKNAVLVGATATSVIMLSLLPGVDVHLVPERIRERVDWKSPPYLTEVEKWYVARRHSLRQREMALALKDLTKPGDSLVTIAIGNLGYTTRTCSFTIKVVC